MNHLRTLTAELAAAIQKTTENLKTAQNEDHTQIRKYEAEQLGDTLIAQTIRLRTAFREVAISILEAVT
jgi:hypothetical protein